MTAQKIVTKNPEFRATIEEKLKKQRFMRHIGFDLTKIEAGYIEGEMPVKSFLYQQDDFVHGGVVATISDIVAGFAAYSLVKPDEKVVTAEIKITYFKPGIGKELRAKGWVEKPGRRFHFCESEVWVVNKGESTRIAKANTTMAVVKPQNPHPHGK